ncbi:hypothetical protein AAC387_Pa12g2114 [Persea americana]
MDSYRSLCLFLFLVSDVFITFGFGGTLPDNEAAALKEIAQKLGATGDVARYFNVHPCRGGGIDKDKRTKLLCNCSYEYNTVCHVTNIVFKGYNLTGSLPPEFAKLPYLQQIDLTRNFLNGTIPAEWGRLPLINISISGNRLYGKIPRELGNISSLLELGFEANYLSGPIPLELGNLTSLLRLYMSSNDFTGELPDVLARLTNLTEFWINDNPFTGKIPDFIQNWTQLQKLSIQGTAMEGPIPSGISHLKRIIDLRISDINGTWSPFPDLGSMTSINTLFLRKCDIFGDIPSFIWNMPLLTYLDLSFNKLTGEIPGSSTSKFDSVFLTRNQLTGHVPDWIFRSGNIDLSYNNLTWEIRHSLECQGRVNLFESSSPTSNFGGDFQCSKKTLPCQHLNYYLRINCGGEEVKDINGSINYEEDLHPDGASNFFLSKNSNWGFSSTGIFMDDGNSHDTYRIAIDNISRLSMPNPKLYSTARLAPSSLSYYGFCLGNGNYNVNLHFAEILFTDDKTYASLGRRVFDVYVQEKLVLKDFNIEKEAKVGNASVRSFIANVTENTLEIRFHWAGKGTESLPNRGTYGPLISAISVEPDFVPPGNGKKIPTAAVLGIVLSAVSLVFLVLGILWKRGCLGSKSKRDQELRGLDLQTGSFTLRQIKAATNNFNVSNKIGEGGFGSVFKGVLLDGTIIAVKQLSSKSRQGNREFLNEIGMISALQHPNLVKLYGCCIEGKQLLLVYEYMENNSLARALFGHEECQLLLDWPTRHKICVGIARGLAFLHEESTLKVVHRDIKATNILLDWDLNPKISDFGLARLDEEENTHISTQIAGTLGYMAPEYAMHGYLTDKADVYSFGVVTLEIVSGKNITSFRPKGDHIHLVDWAYVLQAKGNLLELVDLKLGPEFKKDEAVRMINVALLCTNSSPTLRPTMSAVVSMLEGHAVIQEVVSDPSLSVTDHYEQVQTQSLSTSQTLITSVDHPWTDSSTSAQDLYPVSLSSQYLSNRE